MNIYKPNDFKYKLVNKNDQRITNNNQPVFDIEQSAGAGLLMSTLTVLGNAANPASVVTTAFYGDGGGGGGAKNAIYMRGEIKENKLEVSLISALVSNGVADNIMPVSNMPVPVPVSVDEFSFNQQIKDLRVNKHFIEIKEGKNIYSQHHLAALADIQAAAIAEALRLSNEWEAPNDAIKQYAIFACGDGGILVNEINIAINIEDIGIKISNLPNVRIADQNAAFTFLKSKANDIIKFATTFADKYRFCQNDDTLPTKVRSFSLHLG
jgi:hypothetical protein